MQLHCDRNCDELKTRHFCILQGLEMNKFFVEIKISQFYKDEKHILLFSSFFKESPDEKSKVLCE